MCTAGMCPRRTERFFGLFLCFVSVYSVVKCVISSEQKKWEVFNNIFRRISFEMFFYFWRDIFTTLIDVQWRYLLGSFAITFLTSWTLFACMYSIILVLNGEWSSSAVLNGTTFTQTTSTANDNDKGELYAISTTSDANSEDAMDSRRCLVNVNSLLDAFLFSVEAQHTIGFGHRWDFWSALTEMRREMYRYISSECKSAIFVMCAQCICGLLIQSFMVGLVFAKMARPKKRGETLMFRWGCFVYLKVSRKTICSDNAVISLRDGQLCFLLRCGDMRNTHLVEAHIRMQMIRQRITEEGEVNRAVRTNPPSLRCLLRSSHSSKWKWLSAKV